MSSQPPPLDAPLDAPVDPALDWLACWRSWSGISTLTRGFLPCWSGSTSVSSSRWQPSTSASHIRAPC
ncbi:MAG: hypothetical protein ACXVW2_08095, partial [Nocardioidaceae bacterium]